MNQSDSAKGWRLIAVGFVCALVGPIIPFLMILGLLESTLLLNFFAVILSVSGLTLGIIGSVFLVKLRKE